MEFSATDQPLPAGAIERLRRVRRRVIGLHGALTVLGAAALPGFIAWQMPAGAAWSVPAVLIAVVSPIVAAAIIATGPDVSFELLCIALYGILLPNLGGPGDGAAPGWPLCAGAVVFLLFNAGLQWRLLPPAGLEPMADDHCERLLEVCSADPECDAYRLKVLALGRGLTQGEAQGLVAWHEGAAERERQRRKAVACAMLKNGDTLAGVSLSPGSEAGI